MECRMAPQLTWLGSTPSLTYRATVLGSKNRPDDEQLHVLGMLKTIQSFLPKAVLTPQSEQLIFSGTSVMNLLKHTITAERWKHRVG